MLYCVMQWSIFAFCILYFSLLHCFMLISNT